MGEIITFVIWLVLALLVLGAILGLVKAVLASPIGEPIRPYSGVIYALVVLLCVLVLYQMFAGSGGVPVYWNPRR